MSKKFIPKRKFSVKKNSSGEQSPKLLKTLNKMILNREGSVNFVKIHKRLKNIHGEHDSLEEIEEKSIRHIKLNPMVFENKTPNDLVWLLECMKHDFGFDYYTVI